MHASFYIEAPDNNDVANRYILCAYIYLFYYITHITYMYYIINIHVPKRLYRKRVEFLSVRVFLI